jgi:hypothetical protein
MLSNNQSNTQQQESIGVIIRDKESLLHTKGITDLNQSRN